MKNYVEDLFKYINAYETKYSSFKTEAFFQTYNGVYTVFQPLRQQRNQAVELDYFLLDRVRETPLTTSDLRQLAIQILITYFESEADTDGRSNQAYSHCRGLRAVKQDVPFFENHLVPMLCKPGSLKDNYQLNAFFLQEIARFLNTFGKRLKVELTPEAFNSMADPMKFLELARRRLQLGDDLLKDRASLEFHLHRIDAFTKLGSKNKLFKQLLSDWGYLKKGDFWARFFGFFGELFRKLKGAFLSGRYLRLILSQRKPAYLFYSIIIIIFLLAAVAAPMFWGKYTDTKLEQLEQRATNAEKGLGG